jgi:hypothetical protein
MMAFGYMAGHKADTPHPILTERDLPANGRLAE